MTQTILLWVGRDDWQKDASLNAALLASFAANNIKIAWEDPATVLHNRVKSFERRLPRLPGPLRKLNLRLTQLVYCIAHPSYFLFLYKRKTQGMAARCEALKRLILRIGDPANIVILSRSSGGIAASLIADELGLKQLICLGYPFKHPDRGDEPCRYAHLTDIRTPMLIIQGINDEYGGLDITINYPFSQNVDVCFINTSHDFDISQHQLNSIVSMVASIVTG